MTSMVCASIQGLFNENANGYLGGRSAAPIVAAYIELQTAALGTAGRSGMGPETRLEYGPVQSLFPQGAGPLPPEGS